MDTTFPFGFDAPVTFYLLMYVLTWMLHVVFMAYVLAGSIYVAWATVFPGRADLPRPKQPLAEILREWNPFMLSGAITAAVAPLLFVQVIYRQQFYTANLLLGWRWLIVIPVLIVAFYLLYLLKSRAIERWPFIARCGTAVGVAGCFVFVAFCWTTNHLLSIDQSGWAPSYQTGVVIASTSQLALRLLTWVAGVFPVMCAVVGWQLAWTKSDKDGDSGTDQMNARTLSRVAVGGLIVAVTSGLTYGTQLSSPVLSHLTGAAGKTWLLVTTGGVVVLLAGWLLQLRRPCFCRRTLTVISVGTLATLAGTACLREIIRVSQSDRNVLIQNCQAAAGVGGLGLFVMFLILNIVLIGVCLIVTRRGIHAATDAPSA